MFANSDMFINDLKQYFPAYKMLHQAVSHHIHLYSLYAISIVFSVTEIYEIAQFYC